MATTKEDHALEWAKCNQEPECVAVLEAWAAGTRDAGELAGIIEQVRLKAWLLYVPDSPENRHRGLQK